MFDYVYRIIENSVAPLSDMDQGLYVLLLLIILLLADGIKVVIEIVHRARPRHFTTENDQVTALIPCHNSANVLGDTLISLQKTFPNDRIIVVDDASTDNTGNVAKDMGVQSYRYNKRKGKVAAIHYGVYRIKTRYTLILDDDTRIGYTKMPTSLLNEGYTAVSFYLLPCRRGRDMINNGKNLISCLQRYEYGKSMEIGKRFQDATLSVSCVSGAAGLFLTERLQKHHHTHSSVFAGEDLERTLKDLLMEGKVGTRQSNRFNTTTSPQLGTWLL
jgi:cellulose synthase/poly-beta-1,6-N-acetylglucosamine synthase-like glycosyltransferase